MSEAPAPAGGDGWSLLGSAIFTGALVGGNELIYWWTKPRPPFRKEYQKDVVYVYQYPRMPCIPSLSPTCLSLETWLRLVDIKFENCEKCLWYRSQENILPFVEINGIQYSGEEKIVAYLSKSRQLTDLEVNVSEESEKKMKTVIDDLMRCYLYFCYVKNVKNLFSKSVIGNHSPTQPIMPWCYEVLVKLLLQNKEEYRNADAEKIAELVSKNMKAKLQAKGFTRFIESEVIERARTHLKHISHTLGNKQFLYNNNKPSLVDCNLFGVIAQMMYVPYDTPFKSILRKDYKKVIDHCVRIKEICWTDWDKILKTRKMNTKYLDDDD